MITLEQVSIKYHNHEILKDVTMTLETGKLYCIIGTNGSGKTTLLRAVMGLITYEGIISINHKDIKEISRKKRASYVSYLPQNRPIPNMDVYTLIAHGRYPHLGFSKVLTKEDKQSIEEAAALAKVTELLDRQVDSLSGGERQRAYIAMMIAQDADIVLLDEVTSFLDIEHQLQVMEVLKSLQLKNKGIVIVAHDLPQAFSVADEIIVVANKEVVCIGKPEAVCVHPIIKETFGVTLKPSNDANAIYRYQLKK